MNIKNHRTTLLLLVIFPIFASFIALFLSINLLVSIFLFYGIPSFYLSLLHKKNIQKTCIFALILTCAYIILESIGSLSNVWVVQSIFPFTVFGAKIEGILWAFFCVYYAVIFYEHLADKAPKKNAPNLIYLSTIVLFSFLLFLVAFFNFPSALNFPYFYFFFGTLFMFIPLCLILFWKKRVRKPLILVSYFFYFHLLYEIIALYLHWWSFPSGGQFIGWISLFGVSFPYEELIFFVLLGVLAFISYYEFFDT